VKSRLGVCLLALGLLAGCGQGGNSFNPTNPALAPATGNDAFDRSAGPAYEIVPQLPDGLRPNASQAAAIGSLKAVTVVKNKHYVDVVEVSVIGCTLTYFMNTVSGCDVTQESATTFNVKTATFKFYSKAKGSGCELAAATYKGPMGQGIVGLTFHPTNLKKCWK
jgi:hypothetical protein